MLLNMFYKGKIISLNFYFFLCTCMLKKEKKMSCRRYTNQGYRLEATASKQLMGLSTRVMRSFYIRKL